MNIAHGAPVAPMSIDDCLTWNAIGLASIGLTLPPADAYPGTNRVGGVAK